MKVTPPTNTHVSALHEVLHWSCGRSAWQRDARRRIVMQDKHTEKRRRLFEAQDEVDTRKDDLLTEVEARLQQQVRRGEIFTIRWRIK